jgi:hypothetical protein
MSDVKGLDSSNIHQILQQKSITQGEGQFEPCRFTCTYDVLLDTIFVVAKLSTLNMILTA